MKTLGGAVAAGRDWTAARLQKKAERASCFVLPLWKKNHRKKSAWEGRPGRDWSRRRRSVSRASQEIMVTLIKRCFERAHRPPMDDGSVFWYLRESPPNTRRLINHQRGQRNAGGIMRCRTKLLMLAKSSADRAQVRIVSKLQLAKEHLFDRDPPQTPPAARGTPRRHHLQQNALEGHRRFSSDQSTTNSTPLCAVTGFCQATFFCTQVLLKNTLP